MGGEIIVCGKDARAHQLLLKDFNVLEKVFGLAAANVVHRIGRDRQTVITGGALGSALHHAVNALHNVIHKGEVALAVTVVEDLDRAVCRKGLGGGVIKHVRPACRAIHRKEPKARGRNVVKLGICMRQELIGLFGGRVETHGVVHLVIGAKGHLLVPAVNGGAGGVNQVLHGVVAAGLKDVVEADEVALDVNVGMVDAVAHAALGSKVHDNVKVMLRKKAVDQGLVANGTLDENLVGFGCLCSLLDEGEAVFLELRIVIVVHVVEAYDRAPVKLF